MNSRNEVLEKESRGFFDYAFTACFGLLIAILCLFLAFWFCASLPITFVGNLYDGAGFLLFSFVIGFLGLGLMVMSAVLVASMIQKKSMIRETTGPRLIVPLSVVTAWPLLTAMLFHSFGSALGGSLPAFLPNEVSAPNVARARELFQRELGFAPDNRVLGLYAWDTSGMMDHSYRIKFFVSDPAVVTSIINDLELECPDGEEAHMEAITSIRGSKPELSIDGYERSRERRSGLSGYPAGAGEYIFERQPSGSLHIGLLYSIETGFVDYWNSSK